MISKSLRKEDFQSVEIIATIQNLTTKTKAFKARIDEITEKSLSISSNENLGATGHHFLIKLECIPNLFQLETLEITAKVEQQSKKTEPNYTCNILQTVEKDLKKWIQIIEKINSMTQEKLRKLKS